MYLLALDVGFSQLIPFLDLIVTLSNLHQVAVGRDFLPIFGLQRLNSQLIEVSTGHHTQIRKSA